jgi:ATP-dependent Clp protease, protease subunit
MNKYGNAGSYNNEEKETPTPSGVTQAFTPIDQHLFESRVVFVSGEVNSELALKVNRQLLAMERANPAAPILLWIDSPGGEIFSGFSIYDTARFIQPRVITLAAGFAASMGSVIALAAEKEDRLSFPNAKFLIHQPLISGVMRGNASEIEIHALDIIETKKKLHRLYAERTGHPLEKFQDLMDRDHWIEPAGALELGLISKVVHNRKELDALVKKR